MGKQLASSSGCYQLYCRDKNSDFATVVSVLGIASTGISTPEYVSFMRKGRTWTGFLKRDGNELNENDIEFVLSQVGGILSVPMAEVLRTYEDPLYTKPHSIISVSVAQKENEQFISFNSMQDELYWDLKAGTIPMTPWLETWLRIRNRRENNPTGIWEICATSTDDCDACLQYPFEIADRWTHKHGLQLIHFEESILRMVTFDILVGQTDRTPANYGLLVDWKQGTASLSPLFDSATLRKPYIGRMQNGFNRLLIDRTVLAISAYQKWKEAFLSCAAEFLGRKHEIFDVLNSSDSLLSEEKLCFLQDRLRASFDLLNRIVNNYEKLENLLTASCCSETSLHAELERTLSEHGMKLLCIERMGEMGWEPKYRVDTTGGRYFVKFSLHDRFSDEILALMKNIQHHTQSVSIPLLSQNLPGIDRQMNLYEWIDGIDLREIIRSKTVSECYQIGIRCGRLLKDIHSSAVTNMQDTYDTTDRIDECFRILAHREDLLPQRHRYLPQIQRWKVLLRRKHQPTLVHMDFVPKNIMVCGNDLVVIDWDSCVIADPWLDFFDKGLATYPEKQALNAGVIDGYFDGNVPSEFWLYFKGLSVFALLQATVWAINRNDTAKVEPMESFLCDSYENFERDIPFWYGQYTQVVL